MITIERQLEEVAELIRTKHQPGQHDQGKHDPTKGGGGGGATAVSSAREFGQRMGTRVRAFPGDEGLYKYDPKDFGELHKTMVAMGFEGKGTHYSKGDIEARLLNPSQSRWGANAIRFSDADSRRQHANNVSSVKRALKLKKNRDGSFSGEGIHYPEDAAPRMRKLGFEQTYEGSETGQWLKGGTRVDFEVYSRSEPSDRTSVPQLLSARHPGTFRFYDEANGE